MGYYSDLREDTLCSSFKFFLFFRGPQFPLSPLFLADDLSFHFSQNANISSLSWSSLLPYYTAVIITDAHHPLQCNGKSVLLPDKNGSLHLGFYSIPFTLSWILHVSFPACFLSFQPIFTGFSHLCFNEPNLSSSVQIQM